MSRSFQGNRRLEAPNRSKASRSHFECQSQHQCWSLSTMLRCKGPRVTQATVLGANYSIFSAKPFLRVGYPFPIDQVPRRQRRFNATAPIAKRPVAERIVSSLPSSVKPYAYLVRLDKPIGSWLLFWPCGNFHPD